MKALKIIGVLLLTIVALVVVIAFFLPRKVKVERSMVMEASAATVFEQVNSLKNWKKWDPWHEKEPDMGGSVYSGPEKGEGASHSWDSEHPEIGKGSQTIIETEENKFIKTKLDFAENGTSFGKWSFNETDKGTEVVWSMEMDMGYNPVARYLGIMMEDFIAPDFEKGLANLKNLTESLPDPEPLNIHEVSVDEPQLIISILDTVDMEGMKSIHGELFSELKGFMDENNMQHIAPPLAIYHDWTAERIVLEAGIPVQDSVDVTGRIQMNVIPAGKAVTATHWGNYDELDKTHEKINGWLTEKGISPSGAPWEIYMTDPGNEPDISKWQTQIFYPVK